MIKHTARGDTMTVVLEGELDHHSAQSVRAELESLIASPHVRHLVLDLGKLGVMDSSGIGVVLVVLSLLLVAGLGGTAYYPSNANLQSSLTISNSCSSEFTLRTMFYVSLLVPFVFAYIAYVWRVMDKK